MNEQITITSEQQVSQLLQIFNEVEVLVPQLTKEQRLMLNALQHQPLWERVGMDKFNEYKKQTIEFQSKIMSHTLEVVMDQMKHMFEDMSELDERILRENFYIKTPEYKMLGKGMMQAFFLINGITGAMARPDANEYKPANN